MSYRKFKSKRVALLAILVLAATGFLVYRFWPGTETQPPSQSNGQTQTSSQSSVPARVETADFQYQKPAGWTKLSQTFLASIQANSGIGRTSQPTTQFSVQVASSAPANNTELKNSTLNELKKHPKFELLSSTSIKVDNKPAQKFTYRLGDKDKRYKQELDVIVYKQKTFFLLFSSRDSDFDGQNADFANILSGFKFK